ncbi:MAG: helix-turn-helix transcriptional regulator [Oculatellaceae cyanobacterium Prado106]|jgi:DNA-binding CsgD family transcriptional regulator|nr:helix-turn-helix transcriptional regulator [Oculatellaceae cyanobacterium Prado106]
MANLTQTDWQRMHEFWRSLYTPCRLDEFPMRIMTALPRVVGAELLAVASHGDHTTTLPRICSFPDPEIGQAAEQFIAHPQNFFAHPVAHHYAQTLDGQALAISDFLSESEFHRDFLYSGLFQSIGLEDQMAISVKLPAQLKTASSSDPFHQGKEHLMLLMSRDRRNFTERDRLILNLIRPHLKQAYENIAAFNRLQQQVAKHQAAIEQTALISLSADGKVKWMTQIAGEILHRYFPPSSAIIELPDSLQRWVDHHVLPFSRSTEALSTLRPLTLELNGQRLTIRFSCNTKLEQLYLLLEETQQPEPFSIQSLQVLGLTQREAEVLFWIAKDQSTQEIAQELGMSDRTVKKHIEHIYEKLGVQTRLGAVMYALEKLGIANL